MRRRISETIVRQSSRYCPAFNLLYLNNPKAACSSIKASIWGSCDRMAGVETFNGNPHARHPGAFEFDIIQSARTRRGMIDDLEAFSVVRNPFTRILASYLDKVGSDKFVWDPFCKRFALRGVLAQTVGFNLFLKLICSEIDELLDPHFRTQTCNLWHSAVGLDFIGSVEDMAPTDDWLASRGIASARHIKPESGALDLLDQYYGPEEVGLVLSKFHDDFAQFGYSTDLNEAFKPPVLPGTTSDKDALSYWIEHDRPPAGVLDACQQKFFEFKFAKDKKQRTEIALAAWPIEDSWRNLKNYASHLLLAEDFAAAQKVTDKMSHLFNAHCRYID